VADLACGGSGIFLARNLDAPNRVEMAGEIRFFAQRLWQPSWALEQDISSQRTPHEHGDMRRCSCEVHPNWPGASSLPNFESKALPHFVGGAERWNSSSKSLSSWSKFLALGGLIHVPASPYSLPWHNGNRRPRGNHR